MSFALILSDIFASAHSGQKTFLKMSHDLHKPIFLALYSNNFEHFPDKLRCMAMPMVVGTRITTLSWGPNNLGLVSHAATNTINKMRKG